MIDLAAAITHNKAHANKLSPAHRADLESAGNEGIAVALSRFDEDKGFQFVTFASFYIHKYQREALKSLRAPFRLPANAVFAGESVPVEEVLDLAEDLPEEPDDRCEAVLAGLADLSDRDREAIRLRFFEGLTLKEMAKRLRLKKTGAALRVSSALKRLRIAVTEAQEGVL